MFTIRVLSFGGWVYSHGLFDTREAAQQEVDYLLANFRHPEGRSFVIVEIEE